MESIRNEQSVAATVSVASPTGALVTDNHGGLLIPIRLSHELLSKGSSQSSDEFVYRVSPDGDVLFKLPLPRYMGTLHDDMVIGENDVAFLTRGSVLIAFDLSGGKELWRWDSKTPDISVFVALREW